MKNTNIWSNQLTSDEIDRYIYLLSQKVGVVNLSYGPGNGTFGVSNIYTISFKLNDVDVSQSDNYLADLLMTLERVLRSYGVTVNSNFILEDWQQEQDSLKQTNMYAPY